MATILASTSQAAAATTTTSAFAFNADNEVIASCTNGATPPNSGCQVILQASVDNVNWNNLDRRSFGVAPSQLYYQTFELAQYTGGQSGGAPTVLGVLQPAAGWLYYRLQFAGNDTQAVTVAATDADPIEVQVVTLAGTTATTGGAIGAWSPPQGGPILITNLVIYSTANSTGAANISAGVAANATTSSATLVNAQALGSAANTAIFSGTGTSATVGSILTGTQAVTFTGSANSSGYAGKAYITYIKP